MHVYERRLSFVRFCLDRKSHPAEIDCLRSTFSCVFQRFETAPRHCIVHEKAGLLRGILLRLGAFTSRIARLSPQLVHGVTTAVSRVCRTARLKGVISSYKRRSDFCQASHLSCVFHCQQGRAVTTLLSVMCRLSTVHAIRQATIAGN